MEWMLETPWLLAGLFAVIAFGYASVGLGGGSLYTTLLAVTGVGFQIIPTISLSLNLMVTFLGSVEFSRSGHGQWKKIIPFLLGSIPMAFLGGTLNFPRDIFYKLLLLSLLLVAIRMYFWRTPQWKLKLSTKAVMIFSIITGGLLGFIAGTVGIGGGIYLVPILIILGLYSAREAAAIGSVFICVNSLSGLAARLLFNQLDITLTGEFIQTLSPLLLAVSLGGWLGAHSGANIFNLRTMERLLGGVILLAIIMLGRKVIL